MQTELGQWKKKKKTRRDTDNEIFSEPLHADASQHAGLNGQMMGGSHEERDPQNPTFCPTP